ncbi:MAG: ATP-grasp domain-containing protein [Ignavibacteriae bacterium]|nr:ATP-grasp domain-containing protein [Ignavibacteriota bacterium]
MLRRLHVALVYNVKNGNTEVETNEHVREESADDTVEVLAPVKAKLTRDDTYLEWDSEETIQAVKAALEEGHTVTLIEANEDAFQKLSALRPDIVFNIAEGLRGASREAQVPAFLEFLGIPYTGSDPVTLGICLDKSRAKEILSHYKIPTAPFVVVSSLEELNSIQAPFPAVVKPLYEGSSKGVLNSSIVRTPEELHREVKRVLEQYDEPALVEKFLSGREFTVALLGNGESVRVLPVVEVRLDKLPPGANPIYSYEAKWMWDQPDHPINMYDCPANIDAALDARIQEICKQAYTVLRVRDWCRMDVRLDETGEPNIIELNPLPGILPNPDDHSCFPMAARKVGINYNQLLNNVLDNALARHGMGR